MENDQDTLVQVEIHGQTYNLRSGGDPRAVKQIAALVDDRMSQIAAQSSTADTARIAILAALNLASDLVSGETPVLRADDGDSRERDEALCRALDEILLA